MDETAGIVGVVLVALLLIFRRRVHFGSGQAMTGTSANTSEATGVLRLDADNHVVSLNAAAEAMIADRGGLSVQNETLVAGTAVLEAVAEARALVGREITIGPIGTPPYRILVVATATSPIGAGRGDVCLLMSELDEDQALKSKPQSR